jgi:hypothetical protein
MFGLQEYASTLSELKEKIMETGWSDGYAVLKDQCYQYLIEIKEQALQHQFS